MNDLNRSLKTAAEQHLTRCIESIRESPDHEQRLIGIFAESLIEEVGSIITGRPDRDTMIHLLGAAGLAGMPSPYVADITIGANRELDYVWMRYEVGNKRRSLTWSMRDYLAARSDPTFRPNARSDDIKEIPTSDG